MGAELIFTLLILAILVLLFALFWIRERRPKPLGRMLPFPYIPAMILCAVLAIAAAVHAIGLLNAAPAPGGG